MTDPISDALTQKDKISVLMGEYSALKSEIVQKNTAVVQTIQIASAGIVGLLALVHSSTWLWYLLSSAILLTVINLVLIDWASAKARTRVGELERDINRRAGERLLRWQSEIDWDGPVFPRRRKRPMGEANT
jgi:ABC-type siderophore export system fused ATPase/permease subunit